jgi:hypothetical protein
MTCIRREAGYRFHPIDLLYLTFLHRHFLLPPPSLPFIFLFPAPPCTTAIVRLPSLPSPTFYLRQLLPSTTSLRPRLPTLHAARTRPTIPAPTRHANAHPPARNAPLPTLVVPTTPRLLTKRKRHGPDTERPFPRRTEPRYAHGIQ